MTLLPIPAFQALRLPFFSPAPSASAAPAVVKRLPALPVVNGEIPVEGRRADPVPAYLLSPTQWPANPNVVTFRDAPRMKPAFAPDGRYLSARFLIGHPAYDDAGPNRCGEVLSRRACVAALMDRGVKRADARRMVKQALAGSHATGRGGDWGNDTVELVAHVVGWRVVL